MTRDDEHFFFAWLQHLGVAIARKKLTNSAAGTAIFVALSSTGTSGEDATVDARRIAAEIGLSERQVWRHWKTLVAAGWFAQTALPVSDG